MRTAVANASILNIADQADRVVAVVRFAVAMLSKHLKGYCAGSKPEHQCSYAQRSGEPAESGRPWQWTTTSTPWTALSQSGFTGLRSCRLPSLAS